MDTNNTNQTGSLNADVVNEASTMQRLRQIWPIAKEAIDIIRISVKNPFVKLIIGVVESVGDSLLNSLLV